MFLALQLLEDGTGTMDYDGVLRELSWDETDITMDGVADAYTLADGLLTMADENMELVFARAAGNLMAAGTDGDGAGDQNGEDEATTQREAQIWQAERQFPCLERPKMR